LTLAVLLVVQHITQAQAAVVVVQLLAVRQVTAVLRAKHLVQEIMA
jgi:hypothetical protein